MNEGLLLFPDHFYMYPQLRGVVCEHLQLFRYEATPAQNTQKPGGDRNRASNDRCGQCIIVTEALLLLTHVCFSDVFLIAEERIIAE